MRTSILLLAVSGATAAAAWPTWPTRSLSDINEWEFGFATSGAIDPATIQPDDPAAATSGNVSVPSVFDLAPPGVPGRRGTAFYRSTVHVTPGRTAVVRFGGCAFFCRVAEPASRADLAQHNSGGYTPFAVTLPPSENASRTLWVLANNEFNRSLSPLYTGGDFYHFGGLHRSVVLEELSPAATAASTHIRRAEVRTADVKAGLVTVDVLVALAPGSVPCGASFSLSFDGQEATRQSTSLTPSGRARLEGLSIPGEATPWSLGRPALHTVQIGLLAMGDSERSAADAPMDAVVVRFGLRTISVSSTGHLLLNGEPIFLKGYNRHTIQPGTGSAQSAQQVDDDVKLLREVGANFVRGAH